MILILVYVLKKSECRSLIVLVSNLDTETEVLDTREKKKKKGLEKTHNDPTHIIYSLFFTCFRFTRWFT